MVHPQHHGEEGCNIMSAIGGISGLLVLTLSFVDPDRSSRDGVRQSGRYGILACYCALMLEAPMIGVQRAISLFNNTLSACWPRRGLPGTSFPNSMRRLRVPSSSSARSRASVSRSRIGFGVPFGANNANHPVA